MKLHLLSKLFLLTAFLVSGVQGTGVKGEDVTTFLELATKRFEARVGRPATPEELTWTFNKIQFVRVPKAGSTSASVLARRLAGCYPRGPCCINPKGNQEANCPSQNAHCVAVTGCLDHNAPDQTMLEDPSTFSMANLRDIVDRLVSAFLYDRYPDLPCYKKKKDAHPNDHLWCFLSTVITPEMRNVASRMFSGWAAHDSEVMCMNKADSKGCNGDLQSTIRGVCKLNFILMCELWSTSVLLLFETLPWLAPSEDFFPLPPTEDSEGALIVTVNERKNTSKEHEEGVKHITQAMRGVAGEANAVDEELHKFVSAKFCDRLDKADLLNHRFVVDELTSFEKIYERCTNSSWISETLEHFAPLEPEKCRLYEPLPPPAELQRG